MSCQLIVTSSPVIERGPKSITTSPTENVIAPRCFTVNSASDVQLCIDDYTVEVAATGKPAAIVGFKPSRCRGRKPSGFDAACGKTRYVNLEKLEVAKN